MQKLKTKMDIVAWSWQQDWRAEKNVRKKNKVFEKAVIWAVLKQLNSWRHFGYPVDMRDIRHSCESLPSEKTYIRIDLQLSSNMISKDGWSTSNFTTRGCHLQLLATNPIMREATGTEKQELTDSPIRLPCDICLKEEWQKQKHEPTSEHLMGRSLLVDLEAVWKLESSLTDVVSAFKMELLQLQHVTLSAESIPGTTTVAITPVDKILERCRINDEESPESIVTD